VQKSDGTFTAAVGRVSPAGKLEEVRNFQSESGSVSVRDAIPLAPNEFVSVRDSGTLDPARRAIVMSWVSIK
jgi:hypothetical protein